MDFLQPSALPPIATYRVMNADGTFEDKHRKQPDVPDDEVLIWYKNMLTD